MNAVMAIAGATFGEAIRKRILIVILLIALLIILISPAFGPFAGGRGARTMIISFGFGVIQLAGTFIAIIMCTTMIPTEIERRTIYTILSKPVQRYQFVLGKFFGAIGTLGFMYLMMGIVFLIATRFAIGEFDARIIPGLIMFFFQSSLLAAVVLFFSTFVSPLVNYFLSGGVFLLGNLLSSFLETIQRNPEVTPLTRIPVQILTLILPNFSNFNVQNPIINPEQVITDPVAYTVQTLAYALVYMTMLLVLSMLIFNQREM
ncbi:MAG: ABC transporter permease [Fimbriimonadales bacterium]|nr:ABC transporter permease [Fimbriimonadales bacterium]MDW8051034.1 ABC transporter permease [Armatimonadota bacterium]